MSYYSDRRLLELWDKAVGAFRTASSDPTLFNLWCERNYASALAELSLCSPIETAHGGNR